MFDSATSSPRKYANPRLARLESHCLRAARETPVAPKSSSSFANRWCNASQRSAARAGVSSGTPRSVVRLHGSSGFTRPRLYSQLGCIGNRVYTGLGEGESSSSFAAKICAVADALAVIAAPTPPANVRARSPLRARHRYNAEKFAARSRIDAPGCFVKSPCTNERLCEVKNEFFSRSCDTNQVADSVRATMRSPKYASLLTRKLRRQGPCRHCLQLVKLQEEKRFSSR